MKLAVFYPDSMYCAWSCGPGLVATLERMGHEVLAQPVDHSVAPCDYQGAQTDVLKSCDGIIVSCPEWLWKHIRSFYRSWNQIKVPKVGWLAETVEREDYGRLPIEEILRVCDTTFTPAIQDEKYGMKWLPFGVDTQVFNTEERCLRDIDTGFIGLLYPKRIAFLEKLKAAGLNLRCGNVAVTGFEGFDQDASVRLYAKTLQRINVFVNLPTLSQLCVTKVTEAVACGCMVFTPQLADNRNFGNLPIAIYNSDTLLNTREFAWVGSRPSLPVEHSLETRIQTLIAALKEKTLAA